jgi:hypothetical protein
MFLLKRKSFLGFVLGITLQFCLAQAAELPAWDFSGKEASLWISRAHQCKVRVEDGVLKGVSTGGDPFLTSPCCLINATASQVIEFRAKNKADGRGELFWLPQGAKSAKQKWSVSFEWIGDGQWHDYRVRPFWQAEKKIGAFRLDFVNARADGFAFELSEIRIVEEAGPLHAGEPLWLGAALKDWNPVDGATTKVKGGLLDFHSSQSNAGVLVSPMLAVDSDMSSVVAIEMAASEGDSGTLLWASDSVSGLHSKKFKVNADGRFHKINIDLCGDKNWKGKVLLLKLLPVDSKGGSAQLRSVRICDELQGGADVIVRQAMMANAINRAGVATPVLMQFQNVGGQDAENVRLAVKSLPEGVRIHSASGWDKVAEIPASRQYSHVVELISDRPVSGMAEFTLKGDGLDGELVQAKLEILPDLKLPKASYVPVPKPVKSDYDIGALYFPGWSQISAWARVWPVAPERKPVLGWYDEANPEVVDWQIKWAVENGLNYFLVDWYWSKGYQHHDHWIKAFKQARYKSYLKFALMWANHNAKGSHSLDDQRQVAKFWIENYFNMPEYYRIDDKPVVMIWSPSNMNRDVPGGDGCRQLLELSRKMARDAGYKGIYFIAMKWPEATWTPSVVQGLKEMGFDMTSIYHFMDHGGKAENPKRFSFELVADANAAHWKGQLETGVLPFLPNLSTGWDSRPWHGDRATEIYGRKVEHFQRICRDAKKFADESGVKRMVLAPLNEWGEGSYAEPCAEFGFGMYEAVRNAFCEKPADGWPVNYAPADVGLGPYDLPIPLPDTSTDWTFRTGMQGWSALMGIKDCKTGDAGLSFITRSKDPALARSFDPVRARRFERMVVRMKLPVSMNGGCQLFWSSGGTPTEGTSLVLPLAADGEFHDYTFELNKARAWRGRVSYLRFDPCSANEVAIAIDSIRLVPAKK